MVCCGQNRPRVTETIERRRESWRSSFGQWSWVQILKFKLFWETLIMKRRRRTFKIINDGIFFDLATKTTKGDATTSVQKYKKYLTQCKTYEEKDATVFEAGKKNVGNGECISQNSKDLFNEEASDVYEGCYSDVESGSKMKSGSMWAKKRRDAYNESKIDRVNLLEKRLSLLTSSNQISTDDNNMNLNSKLSPATFVEGEKIKHEEIRYWIGRKNVEKENNDLSDQSSLEQSKWGSLLPVPVLIKIFSVVTREDGCLPFLVRMSYVCYLWREAALAPSLWNTIDLSGQWVDDKYKSETQLAWLCENRLSLVQDLNIGGWEVSEKRELFQILTKHCPKIHGINLTGWIGLQHDHLEYLISNCRLLSRINLTGAFIPRGSIRSNRLPMKGFRNLCETLGAQLTHLILRENLLPGANQIVPILTANCPNLEVLDISKLLNLDFIRVDVEKFQTGCQKLKVFQVSDTNFAVLQTSLKKQMESPGFPLLEELHVGSDGSSHESIPIIDGKSLERILKTSCKLRLLDIRGCNVTASSLQRVPALDIEHLLLSGCEVTRTRELESIIQKWKHSFKQLDLGRSCYLDKALDAFAEKGEELPLRIIDLHGTSVSLDSVKAVLMRSPDLQSLNLTSCRALPRGMKRLYEGTDLTEFRNLLLEES